jgi:hypothetical protein
MVFFCLTISRRSIEVTSRNIIFAKHLQTLGSIAKGKSAMKISTLAGIEISLDIHPIKMENPRMGTGARTWSQKKVVDSNGHEKMVRTMTPMDVVITDASRWIPEYTENDPGPEPPKQKKVTVEPKPSKCPHSLLRGRRRKNANSRWQSVNKTVAPTGSPSCATSRNRTLHPYATCFGEHMINGMCMISTKKWLLWH